MMKTTSRILKPHPSSSTATSTSTNSSSVLYRPPNDNFDDYDHDEQQQLQRCRHCLSSSSLVTDWAQGDRVCVQCGIVQDERLRDTRPEWRSFTEDTTVDPNSHRCGLVPNDETKYWGGGLEPTRLSTHVFGGGGGSDDRPNHAWRKRLMATQRKIEKMMEQERVRSMKDAKVAQQIVATRRKRQRPKRPQHDYDDDDDEEYEDEYDEYDNTNSLIEDVRPDYEQLLLREEEEAQRVHATLCAAKWSLDRALLLHGPGTDDASGHDHHQQVVRDELWQQLDKSLRQASADIYQAYRMLTDAAQRLELPNRITREALHMLCRYATQRDGLFVKGVSSRIVSVNNKAMKDGRGGGGGGSGGVHASQQNDNKDDLARRLRDYNKLKQIGSLCSALLFLTARNLGWTRSLLEVCDCFQGTLLQTTTTAATTTRTLTSTSTSINANHIHPNDSTTTSTSMSFIKPKHCSKAMNEIKKIFPDFGRSIPRTPTTSSMTSASQHDAHRMNNHVVKRDHPGTHTSNGQAEEETVVDVEEATGNFLTHSLRKLHLPPVAEESIRTLVRHCRQEQVTLGRDSGMKPSTLCASMAFLVCVAGACMQRLAEQGRSANTMLSSSLMGTSNFTIPRKRPATAMTSSPTVIQSLRVVRKRRTYQSMSVPQEAPKEHPTDAAAAVSKESPSQQQEEQTAPTMIESSPSKPNPKNKQRKFDAGSNASLFDDPVDEPESTYVPQTEDGAKMDCNSNTNKNADINNHGSEPFDVFSHPAIVASDLSDRQAYEMRRMWDTWSEQMSWTRSLGEIENSCGVSKSVILEAYQSKLYPRRTELLNILQESVKKSSNHFATAAAATTSYFSDITGHRSLASTPLASSLLSHITAAAPLLSKKEGNDSKYK